MEIGWFCILKHLLPTIVFMSVFKLKWLKKGNTLLMRLIFNAASAKSCCLNHDPFLATTQSAFHAAINSKKIKSVPNVNNHPERTG